MIKHSGATTAVGALTGDNGELALVIEDDGCGFDVAAQREDALGLVSMRERVRSIGGRFAIAGVPGQGTRIEVHAPLTPTGAEAR